MDEQLHLAQYFFIFACNTLVVSRLLPRQVTLFFHSATVKAAISSLKNCTSLYCEVTQLQVTSNSIS